MDFYENKKVLVTGGTGLIGRPLVDLLIQRGAKVTVVSLDFPKNLPSNIDFRRVDLREFSHCLDICKGKDIVFQLAGVKGSPAMTKFKPASFFVPTMQFSINMMEAARQCDVERYLFTSSVGVYSPADEFFEDDVWKTFPSENDKFAGWAKRMGELQAQAYEIQFGWKNISIVRPANVYGPYDNFDPKNAMVIPSLIKRVVEGENPLNVWGDGTAIRDFIFSRDVARGMMHAIENNINIPINLGSGNGVSIREITETLVKCFNQKIEIFWDTSKPNGDSKRIMNTSRARDLGFIPETSLEDGISQTIKWYLENINSENSRYNAFTDNKYS